MSSYSGYLAQAQQDALAQQEEYEKKRKAQLKKVFADLEQTAAGMNSRQQQAFEAQASATEQQYRGLYDRNAIREAVSRKTVAEQMANLGLGDSGLNRSQQTAIATTRSKADANTALQQQAAINGLREELFDMLAGNEQWLGEQKAKADTQAQTDIQNSLEALMAQAGDNAKAQFNAAVADAKASGGSGSSSGGSSSGSTAGYSASDLSQYIRLLGDNDYYAGTRFYPHYVELVYALRKRILGR